MAGHNKWTQIKRKKGALDEKRAKLFSVLVKTISLEAKRAGGDRNAPGLRAAVEKASANNMPKENIDRAIEKAVGARATDYTEVVYEAYLPVRQAGGPGGTAILIEGITDNKNRTSQEIKHLLSEHGVTLASPGAVMWAFKTDQKIELSPADQEKLNQLVEALEAHEDIKNVKSTSH